MASPTSISLRLPVAARPLRRLSHWLFERFARTVMWVYCPLDVRGVEHLPPFPFLVCANHCSHLDSIVLMSGSGQAFHRFGMLAAKDYFFRNQIVARCFSLLVNLIPLERSSTTASFNETILLCRQFLDGGGGALILFPEGTRSRTGEIGEFKRGPGVFAAKLGLPIVPAYISGTGAAMPRGYFFPKPGRVRLRFAPAVVPQPGCSPVDLMAETHRRIAALMKDC